MAELDDAYANGAYIADADSYPPRWAKQAAAFRTSLGARAKLGISYGATDRQAFDLFMPDSASKGLFVFVHGGYWLKFDRSYWSHLAQGAVSRGWACAVPSYDLCPTVRIAEITKQVAACVSHAAAMVGGPITLAGHSAGGHLVARMLAPQMLAAPVRDRLAAIMPISPVADLRPLLGTSMNEAFKLDDHLAAAESPVLQPVPVEPVTVVVGSEERPVFLDQARWLADAWDCAHVIVPGQHHFDIIDPLSEADSALTKIIAP